MNKDQTTPGATGTRLNAAHHELLRKAGLNLEAPTGAAIVGVLEIKFGIDRFDGDWDLQFEHLVYIDDDGPVYIDDEGLTWAIGADGRWRPVGVSLRPPQVTILDEPPETATEAFVSKQQMEQRHAEDMKELNEAIDRGELSEEGVQQLKEAVYREELDDKGRLKMSPEATKVLKFMETQWLARPLRGDTA
jgi:hypothetical protein